MPEVAHIDDIPASVPQYPIWRPVRHHFGVTAFGVNAFVAAAGEEVVEDHTELEDNSAGHEELYLVARGRASFTVDGEEIDVPAGTFVWIPEPGARRVAYAREDGTAVLAIGARPGEAYAVSEWELRHFPGDR
jgi:quercetin dioxygenase-like cupin family protein